MDILLPALGLLIVAAVILLRPSAYNVTRDVRISKPLNEVYLKTLDLRLRKEWSPWACMDEACTMSYEGDGTKEGDLFAWDGEFIGSGSMKITQIDANRRIDHDLQFVKPFKSKADVRLEFQDNGNETQVSWIMDGKMPAMMKSMIVGWVGMDFERGLSMLKQWIETGEVLSKSVPEGQVSREEVHYVGRRAECSLDEISSSMESSMTALCNRISEKSIEPANAPFCIYKKYDITARTCEYVMAIPVSQLPSQGSLGSEASWVIGTLPRHQAFKVNHIGSYKNLGNGWATGFNRLRTLKMKPTKALPPYEVYVNDPEKTPEAELTTEIYWPLKA